MAPEHIPDGKVAVILVAVHAVTGMVKLPIVTVPDPVKLVPNIVTLLPGVLPIGVTEAIVGIKLKV